MFQLKLLRRYHIQNLPSLVLVEGPSGKLITVGGRDCLTEDLEGIDFPWRPRKLEEILVGELLSGSERVDSGTALDGKIKGFYFSAHWVCAMFLYLLLVQDLL